MATTLSNSATVGAAIETQEGRREQMHALCIQLGRVRLLNEATSDTGEALDETVNKLTTLAADYVRAFKIG